jgi:hypothetical protein
MFHPRTRGEHMSKIGSTDGLSIIARYTSVVAIAVASTAGSLPKSVSEDVVRSDQVALEQKDDQPESTGSESIA